MCDNCFIVKNTQEEYIYVEASDFVELMMSAQAFIPEITTTQSNVALFDSFFSGKEKNISVNGGGVIA